MRREDSSAAHRVSQIPRPPNREAPHSAAHERTAASVRKPTLLRTLASRHLSNGLMHDARNISTGASLYLYSQSMQLAISTAV